jgi:predicted thioesterase
MEVIKMINHGIQEGLVTDFRKTTSPQDASLTSGSMELTYLVSTPAVINIIIDASSEMLDKLLPPEYITIGTHLEISHENPTLVGEAINLRIKVIKVVNNEVLLEFEGTDSVGLFCRGKYERCIVNKDKLLQSAYARFPDSHNV